MREMLLFLVALILVAVAVGVIHKKVTTIEIGPHSSRLIGTLCAILAYYYWRHSFSLHMPEGAWNRDKMLAAAKVYLPPAILFGAALYYAGSMLRNWRGEFVNLLKAFAWVAVVAGLVVSARYLLGL